MYANANGLTTNGTTEGTEGRPSPGVVLSPVLMLSRSSFSERPWPSLLFVMNLCDDFHGP